MLILEVFLQVLRIHFINHFEKVLAFELDPDTFACLEKNIDIENVSIVNKGLSDTHDHVGIANGRNDNSFGRHVSGNGIIETVTIDYLNLTELAYGKEKSFSTLYAERLFLIRHT